MVVPDQTYRHKALSLEDVFVRLVSARTEQRCSVYNFAQESSSTCNTCHLGVDNAGNFYRLIMMLLR